MQLEKFAYPVTQGRAYSRLNDVTLSISPAMVQCAIVGCDTPGINQTRTES